MAEGCKGIRTFQERSKKKEKKGRGMVGDGRMNFLGLQGSMARMCAVGSS